MKSGSIHNQVQRQPVKASAPKPSPEKLSETQAALEQTNSEEVELHSEPKESADISDPSMPFAFKTNLSYGDLGLKPNESGGYDSDRSFALVDKSKRAELEAQGAIFPEITESIAGDGVGPQGDLGITPLYDTENPETAQIARGIEVDKKLLETDPETGFPLHHNYTPVLLAQGEGVLPVGHVPVSQGARVVPEGYSALLDHTAASAKTERFRKIFNSSSTLMSSLSSSSLAGVYNFSLLTNIAPILALASSGLAINQHMEAKIGAEKSVGQLELAQKKSDNDLVKLTLENGVELPVSAKGERMRLETQIRQARLQLGSTGLLAASGASSIIGTMASAGVSGFAGLAGLAAATPFLAGGALVLGQGGMIFNSLGQLKELSKEKAELLAAQAKGETHVDRVIETNHPQLKRPVAFGDRPVSTPISERLKQVEKQQQTHRLMATVMSGGTFAIGGAIFGLASLGTLSTASLAPAGALLSVGSIAKLRTLSSEKKELQALSAEGQTMVMRPQQQADATWADAKVPISSLLAENKKSSNLHKLILTSTGSAGAVMGATLGAGVAFSAAAPLLLIPVALGAILFPDKVADFGGKVKGFIDGTIGESGRTMRSAKKSMKLQHNTFTETLDKELEPLMSEHPELFAPREGTSIGGVFTELALYTEAYAMQPDAATRGKYLAELSKLVASAPPEAQSGIKAFQESFEDLAVATEGRWVPREVNLAMKTKLSKKTLADERVGERLGELGLPTDNREEQLRESMRLELSPAELSSLLEASRSGDVDASKTLAKVELFQAARLLANHELEMGEETYAQFMDAIQRPEDLENLELRVKEASYRRNANLTDQELEQAKASLHILTQPLQSAENLSSTPRESLKGPEARMEQAFRALSKSQPELTKTLGDSFAFLNTTPELAGMDPAEFQQKRILANQNLIGARQSLLEKEPELMGLWDKARKEVEENHFQRSVDHDTKATVLAHEDVKKAAEKLGVSLEDAEGLYMGLMKSHILQDPRELQARLADPSGESIDPAKSEMLAAIDRTLLKVVGEQTQGGADFSPIDARLEPSQDPKVAQFLKQNPAVGQVLNSAEFQQLSQNMKLPADEVRQAYLTVVQAELEPARLAEFQGAISGGDVQAANTLQVGQAVASLVSQMTRPDPEVVQQQLEVSMKGAVVQTVLNHPDVKSQAEALGVDSEQMMKLLLTAELSRDPSLLGGVEARAQQGDTSAKSEIQMLQLLSQAVMEVSQQVARDGAPPQAA